MGNLNVSKVLSALQVALQAFNQMKPMAGVLEIQRRMGEYDGSDKPVYDARNQGGGLLIPEGPAGQNLGYWRLTHDKLTNIRLGETSPIDTDVSRFVISALLGEAIPVQDSATALLRGVLTYTDCLTKFDTKACESSLTSAKTLVAAETEKEQEAARYKQKWAQEAEQKRLKQQQAEAAAIEAERQAAQLPGPRIAKAEEFVQNALQLAKDMRVAAVGRDRWFNSITPKEVDGVTSRYMLTITSASAATPVEKSELRQKLATQMVEEFFKTETGRALFWDLKSNPLYTCSDSVHASYTETTCIVPGYQTSRSVYFSSGSDTKPEKKTWNKWEGYTG